MKLRIVTRIAMVALLAFAVPLSGCVDAEGDDVEPADKDVPKEAEKAQTTATTGSVTGTVSNDLFEPLGGADVTLVESGQSTKVSRTGAFTVNNIEPGTYTVFVQAIGYESSQRSAVVQAGEVTEIGLQLKPLASDDPWVDAREWQGLVTWAVAWQAEVPTMGCLVQDVVVAGVNVWTIKNCGGLRGGGGENGEIAINVSDDAKTVVAELVWNPAGPLGEFLSLDLMCKDTPRSGGGGAVLDLNHPCYFAPHDSESPISIRVDEEHWLEHGYNYTGDWAARVFSTYGMLGTYDLTHIDVGVAYQQSFTHYTSVFHKAPAPEQYTGIPDA